MGPSKSPLRGGFFLKSLYFGEGLFMFLIVFKGIHEGFAV